MVKTWFCQHSRPLWTWKNPDDNTGNQIDLLLYTNDLHIETQSWRSGAIQMPISTVIMHLCVRCMFQLKLRKLARPKYRSKFDFERLHKTSSGQKSDHKGAATIARGGQWQGVFTYATGSKYSSTCHVGKHVRHRNWWHLNFRIRKNVENTKETLENNHWTGQFATYSPNSPMPMAMMA